MSTITQKIPNLLGGISQQPDVKKIPGQVVDSLNTFPEFALGLMKRPGAKFEAPLRGAADDAKWFSILSSDAKYIGQVTMDGQIPLFRIWFKESGLPRVVDLTDYLSNISSTFYDDLKTSVNTEAAETEDYIEAFAPLRTAQANYLTEYNKTIDQFTSLFEIETTYTGQIKQLIKTAVLEDEDGTLVWYEDENALSGTLSNGIFSVGARRFKKGTERTEEYPILMNEFEDHHLYELVEITEATETADDLEDWVEDNYDDSDATNAVPVFEGHKDDYEDSISNSSNTGTDDRWPTYTTSNNPANNYFVNDKNSDAFDVNTHLKFVTIQDTTFVLNTNKKVEWSTTKTDELKFDEALINFNVFTTGDYTVSITKLDNDSSGNEPHEEGYTRTVDSSFGSSGTASRSLTYSTSLNTVEEFRNNFNSGFDTDLGTDWDDFTFEASGTTIYVSNSSFQFDIEVSGPTDAAVNVIRHTVGNVGLLPVQAQNGYKVKVVNSTDIAVDDMYMVFESEDGQDYSPGSWVESNGGDLEYIIDNTTMPHVLKVQTDGSFKFEAWDGWENRRVGDEETNPTPSFISTTDSGDKYINDIFLYRNRMGFLSDDNVILSRAGHFFDFFAKSAVSSADDDPIDISVSPTQPVTLFYTYQVGPGLLIFGESAQFLLATDSDLLSPKTAKINGITGFTTEPTLPAVSLGPNAGFMTKTQGNTKFIQLLRVGREESPEYIEKTKIVPELLPNTIDTVESSPTLSLVSFGETGKDIVYHFNYYVLGDREVTNTWYRWQLPGTLELQFFSDNVYNVVVKSGSNYYALSFDVAQSSSDGVLELDSGTKTDVCLDVWYKNPFFDYEEFSGTDLVDRTKVLIPFEPFQDKKFAVVIYGEQNTTFTDLSVTADGDDNYVYIDGDWRGYNIILGYEYTMSVELPRFYVVNAKDDNVSADTTATVIINRLQVETGLSGPIDYKVNILGVPIRTQKITVTPANQSTLNSVNLSETGTHTVPIHQRNHNVTVTIEGTTPFPATIESLNWEGRYATNFYRRS